MPAVPAVPVLTEPLSLLLVEDDDGDALLVEDELALTGRPVELRRVRTLAEAHAQLSTAPACVLLDLGLPDSSGLDALREVRAASDVAIVVLTGLDDEAQGVAALAEGAQDYLVKGAVDGAVLLRAVRYAVERRRAERAAVALREAELSARENERLERGLLPQPILEHGGLRATTAYRPGRRRAVLGGDFYDVVQTAEDCVRVLIGDVSGHSADEAAVGAALRIAWRTLVLGGAAPSEVLDVLHRLLVAERHAAHVFATVATMTLQPGAGVATLRLAGHPAPLLLHADGVRQLEGIPGPPLGVVGGGWEETHLELPEQWGLLAFSDGLYEGFSGSGRNRLGVDGLLREIAAVGPLETWCSTPRTALDALVAAVEAENRGPLSDDLATVLISP
jgi:serine phosphatase RsbU (regulator of sigma subunit)